MTYKRPPAFTRKVFNPLAMRLGLGGTQTLAVRRRSSGEEQTVPVIPVDHGAQRYIVSTRGESEWVRNMRAAGGGELRRRDTTETFRATEVPIGERPPIIDAYRKKAGRTVETYFKSLPDPADHPVFRVEARA